MNIIRNIFERNSRCMIAGLALMGAGLFASCASDDGNYDYSAREVISVDIANAYTVEQFDNLVVKPKVSTMEGHSADDYSYMWQMWNSASVHPDTLSRELNLDAKIKSPAGEYYLELEVKNKKSETVVSTLRKTLYVINSFSVGLAILSDVDGGSEITFINSMGTVSENVYETVNGKKCPRGPVAIGFMGNHENIIPMICIGTKEGSVLTNSDDFSYFGPLDDMVYFPSGTCVFQAVGRDNWGMREYAIINGGFHQRGIGWEDTPYLMFDARDGGNGYDLAPFVIMYSTSQKPMGFDKITRSFIYNYFGEDILPVTVPGSTDLFNPNDMQADLMYATAFPAEGDNKHSTYEYVRGVMKNDDGSLYAIGAMKEDGYDDNWNSFYTLTPTHRASLPAGCTHFAASAYEHNFMYCAKGSTLYCVSLVTGNTLSTLDLGQNIDCMKFDENVPTLLYVAVSDGSCKSKSGSMIYLNVDASGTATEIARFSNICGKVVDMVNK